MKGLIAALFFVCLLSACDSDAEQTERATTPSAAVAASPAVSEDQKLAIQDFFKSLETACRDFATRVGNPVVESQRFAEARTIEEQSPGKWLLEDGMGTQLIVDQTARIVTSTEGPDGLMPNPYSFGCPENVFVGTADA